MRRKKIPAFPKEPAAVADFILENENEIKKAVKESLEEISFLSASRLNEGGGGRVSDRTGRTAAKLAEEVPCICTGGGVTVQAPETWLSVLEDVRAKAKTCKEPEVILAIWRAWYGKEKYCFIPAGLPGYVLFDVIDWIRYHVLTGARERGIISFFDAEITSSIEKARADCPAPH